MKKKCFGVELLAELRDPATTGAEMARMVLRLATAPDVRLSPERAALSIDVVSMWLSGFTTQKICAATEASRATVCRIIKEYRAARRNVHQTPIGETPAI